MFTSQRSFRFTAARFAIVAAIGLTFLSFTVIGTNAAGVSFFDTVKELFGLQVQMQNDVNGNRAESQIGNNVFTASSAESRSTVEKAMNLTLRSMRSTQAFVSSGIVISQVYGAGGNSGAVYQNDY